VLYTFNILWQDDTEMKLDRTPFQDLNACSNICCAYPSDWYKDLSFFY